MKGNKLIYSNYKKDRIKGYKKLFKEQEKYYEPPKKIAQGIVEAMTAQGYEIKLDEAIAYMNSSYAVFDRSYYESSR